ncbi:hypothetical protein RYX36_030800, partial [Vicia faba]
YNLWIWPYAREKAVFIHFSGKKSVVVITFHLPSSRPLLLTSMGSRRKVVNSKLVDTLGVAKLSVQSFPDIEPLFVRSHITDLGRTWRILNKEGTHHGTTILRLSGLKR